MIFFSDLDGTLIRSRRHALADYVPVESGRNGVISYTTAGTNWLLSKVQKELFFVPITSRSISQYKRLRYWMGIPDFALVCNGGILLQDGVVDPDWKRETEELVAESGPELKYAMELLRSMGRDAKEVEHLFLYLVEENSESLVRKLPVFQTLEPLAAGRKLYLFPRNLSKGKAVERFCRKFPDVERIAAGDSPVDFSMFEKVDTDFYPIEREGCKIFNQEQPTSLLEQVLSEAGR